MMKHKGNENLKEIITNETHKKVYFIGGDDEIILTIAVKAKTDDEAINKAKEMYNTSEWNSHYWKVKVAKCL